MFINEIGSWSVIVNGNYTSYFLATYDDSTWEYPFFSLFFIYLKSILTLIHRNY